MTSSSLAEGLRHLSYSEEDIQKILGWVKRQGTVQNCEWVRPEHRPIFATALEISPEDHLAMMAAVQPFVSGSISKTVNLPRTATTDEIENLYTQAWRLGVKSISIYRDNSKSSQPLEALREPPLCAECGSTTELSGSCFRCTNCGMVVGCG